MIELQGYLRAHGHEKLCEEYSIRMRRHAEFENLCLFKYMQGLSPMGEKVVQQSRGIILDEANEWGIVSYPYDKFFNFNESHAAKVDWKTASLQKKLDGSLITMYWYNGGWQIATSGTPDALAEVGGFPLTFRDLFWDAWDKLENAVPSPHLKHLCFMFELETPKNRVVVKHSKPSITLHGVRNLKTLKEECPKLWGMRIWVDSVPVYQFHSLEISVSTAKELKPTEQEGFVICDQDFNRVKIKSEAYVRLSHMRDNATYRGMLAIALAGEEEEFLAYFPEFTEEYTKVLGSVEEYCGYVDATYLQNAKLTDQKEFAIAVKDLPFSGALFQMKAGRVKNAWEYLEGIMERSSIKSVEKALTEYRSF